MRDPLALLGCPYVLGCSDPTIGFDCWTLVEFVRRECFGLETPFVEAFKPSDARIGSDTIKLKHAEHLIDAARASGAWEEVTGKEMPGDVVGLSLSKRLPLHHVGVWLPEGVLHAWSGMSTQGIGSVMLTPWTRLSPIFAAVEVYRCRG